MRVELLFRDGDPAAMAARQNLVEVLTQDAFETPIQMVSLASDADAQLLGVPGSPTIRLDGMDIDPDSAQPIGLASRHYPDGAGGTSPVPDKRLIRAAVERARGWAHGRRG